MSVQNVIDNLSQPLKRLPKKWDGKQSILAMKEAEWPQWRQMEWIGFYFEFLCHHFISNKLRMPGPKYDRVGFDGFAEIPWDCKAHAINTSSHQVIVNDSQATARAIMDYGCVGLLLATGKVEYNDEDRAFQQWHETIKGGPSDYTRQRIERGAWSRLRKTQFDLEEIHFIQIDDVALVKHGSFQEDFRNSSGTPRKRKVLVDLEKLDQEILHTIRY